MKKTKDEKSCGIFGIWIPGEVIFNPKLTDKEKLLFGHIQILSATKYGCYMSNRNLGRRIEAGPQTVSNGVAKLKKYKYIKIVFEQKKGTTKEQIRRIYIDQTFHQRYEPVISLWNDLYVNNNVEDCKEQENKIKEVIEYCKNNRDIQKSVCNYGDIINNIGGNYEIYKKSKTENKNIDIIIKDNNYNNIIIKDNNKSNSSEDELSSSLSADDQSKKFKACETDSKYIFNKYLSIATVLKEYPSAYKLIKHKSIDSKVSISKSVSISIRELIYDSLQLYSVSDILQCLDNYKLICMNPEQYWYKPYWKNISILKSKSLLKLLNIDNLKLQNSRYSVLRYDLKLLTVGEYDPKYPLNTETNTYMGINVDTLRNRDIDEYYNDIKTYIKLDEFGKNIAYFNWLEELIVCLIYRKTNEPLLNKLVDLHMYWFRHFKLMIDKEKATCSF